MSLIARDVELAASPTRDFPLYPVRIAACFAFKSFRYSATYRRCFGVSSAIGDRALEERAMVAGDGGKVKSAPRGRPYEARPLSLL